ncbi:Coiled-coil and C2 domain-containing protein 2A [Phytophthora cinnamomi]|uniref:Coiled-coil and C2 domain-containing protein 2A n=1 Tax=Phytophthora cinnamomi TaxID=4785 RepID=UPI003559AD52|nr:Coiled-coil and C2 domain-containing protein 2A [Phytophthora cinnamomi]
MAKGEDTDGQSDAAADQPKTTAKGKSKRKELRIRSRRSPASPENNSNDEQIGDKQNKAKSPKSRTRNEAEKRNQIEKERKLRHDVHERDNYTNNRFLRAISGQKAIPEKEDIQEKKKRGDEDGDDDCDDADTTTSLLKKRETTAIVKSTEGIIVTPAAPYSANGQHSTQASPAAPPANAAQMSPRSTNRLKQKLKMKLALPLRRVHPGSSVLRELQRSKEVCGLPLHVSFTDIPRVLEIVENTNIHYNERPGVEFALAVYVCGYPNCVLSVWVYLAALVPL